MSGPSVGGTSDRWLQPGFAIKKIYEKVEPNLIFGDYLNGPIMEDRASFMYLYDDVGISGDTKKQTAPRFQAGADLPRLDFSLPSTAAAMTESKGFEIAVPRSVVRDGVAGEAAIERYFNRAGYILSEQINTAQYTAMTAGTGSTTLYAASVAAGGVWSGAEATPVTDLMALAEDADIEGYPYSTTEAFVHKNSFYDAKEYLNFIDGGQFNDGRPTGTLVNRDTIYVKQADMTLHKVKSGLTDGDILGIDRNNLGAELHVYSDPMFSTASARVNYKTIVDGKEVTKSAPNMGLHYYEYMEKDTKATIMQFWFENKTVLTEPLAIQYESTGN